MTVTLACPEDNDPLSYDRLGGEWRQWYETAHRFERKVPAQDRGDIRHNIILELAFARARDGDKPFSEAMMCRVASFVVADYWRKAKRKPTILSLDTEIDNGDGDITELIEFLADDNAIDIVARLDARRFLQSFPKRIVQIAYKRYSGRPLDGKEQDCLDHWRKKNDQLKFAVF